MDRLPLPSGLSARPGTPQDFARLAEFHTAAHPDRPVTAAELERKVQDQVPSDVSEMTLIEKKSELLGVVEVSTPRMDDHPGWLRVDITVKPGLEHGALPAQLLAFAESQARLLGAHTLTTSVREHW